MVIYGVVPNKRKQILFFSAGTPSWHPGNRMGQLEFWQPFWVRQQRMVGAMKPRVERCDISAVVAERSHFLLPDFFYVGDI